MPWYDRNLNPIEPPNDDDNNTYIFIQKPHTRTLRFYITGKFIEKRFELPWLVFCYRNKMLLVSISKEMPTLNSQLYIPGFSDVGVCVSKIWDYYEKPTPQNYIDYFWQSSFNISNVDHCQNCQNYLKDPSKYYRLNTHPNINDMTHFMES